MAETATLFVGTYTNLGAEGIYTCRMDVDSGMLEQVAVVGGIDNPSFLAVDPSGEHLYAVCETHDDEGASDSISAYSIGDDGSLTLLNVESTGGPGPCHLAVDSTDSYVIVANYYGGSVCMLPVEADGSLGPRSDFVLHEGSSIDPERQFEPFAHSVTIDSSNSRAYVCDLGMDKILVYRIDHEQGRLIEETGLRVSTEPGHGPRHFAFHPSDRFCYAINEMGSTIAAYEYDSETGRMSQTQLISTLPAGWSGVTSTADIHVSQDGRFVYGSNRGHDSIAKFSVDPDTGRLTSIGREHTLGKTPRNFAITPDGRFLLAENQDSGNIVTFAIDADSGGLEYTGNQISIPGPVCIQFRP
ncbi:MAG: lactonase family protein [Chloroflexi bacterium]|nr:lactonase family protein [Chloroflexota bacterium]MCY3936866.1 lactonase family protein [Chloroflexota bacterium]